MGNCYRTPASGVSPSPTPMQSALTLQRAHSFPPRGQAPIAATHSTRTLGDAPVPMHPPARRGPAFPRPPPRCHTHKSPRAGRSRTAAARKEHASPFPAPPRPGRPAGLCAPRPPPSLRAHPPASGAEAAARPGAGRGRPAAGRGPGDSPSRRGPHPRSGTGRGGCGEWRLHGLRARTRGGQLHSGSAGDCPRPRPGLALHSRARPGGPARREAADSWWGEFGKFVLSADWVEPGPALGPARPAPLRRRRKVAEHPALEFRVPGSPQTLSS